MARKVSVFEALMIICMLSYCLVGTSVGMESIRLDFKGNTITANVEDASLKNVFQKINYETGIWFNAPKDVLSEKISFQFDTLSFHEGLKRILRTMNYSFIFDRNYRLLGTFIIGKTSGIRKADYLDELNGQMMSASIEGRTTAVMELLSKGAEVNLKGKSSGWTPLMLAARKGNIELVEFLLIHGADINEKSSIRSRNAIMEAVRNRNVDAVEVLLTADPDLNAVDWEGYTALMFAAVSGQLDIVNALLYHGADVNMKNNMGSSALLMASGYPNIVKILKEAGAKE